MTNLFVNETEERTIVNTIKGEDKNYDVFYRHYNHFINDYNEMDACIISNLFERSMRNAEAPASELISKMKQVGELSVHVSVNGVELYAHQGTEPVEHHYITLEEALLLCNNNIVSFDRNGQHLMEYFGLC